MTIIDEGNGKDLEFGHYDLYNPITEALSFSQSIRGNNGKKLVRLN